MWNLVDGILDTFVRIIGSNTIVFCTQGDDLLVNLLCFILLV